MRPLALVVAILVLLAPLRASATLTTIAPGDTTTLRATIAAANDGDIIYLQSGDYTITRALTLSRGIWIHGEGKQTRLMVTNAMAGVFEIDSTVAIDRLRIGDLYIHGNGTGSIAGTPTLDGIHYGGAAALHVTNLILERLNISGFRNGIKLNATNLTNASINHCTISDCEITTLSGRGIWLMNVSMARIERCEINACGLNGIFANLCPTLTIFNTASEANNTTLDTSQESGAQVTVKLCHHFSILGLDVETFQLGANTTRIGLAVSNCTGGFVAGYGCSDGGLKSGSIAIAFILGTRGVVVGSMTYALIEKAFTTDATSSYVQPWPRTITKF